MLYCIHTSTLVVSMTEARLKAPGRKGPGPKATKEAYPTFSGFPQHFQDLPNMLRIFSMCS